MSEVLHYSRRRASLALRTLTRPWQTVSLFLKLRHDVLGGLTLLADTEGDRVLFRLGPVRVLVLNDPPAVHEILVAQHRAFRKPKGPLFLARILGDGLLTAEEPTWRHARRLIQPAFHSEALRAMGGQMVTLTERHLASWDTGREYDIADEMASLAFTIATDTLFGFRDDAVNREVRASISSAMRYANRRMYALVRIPTWIPTRNNREFSRASRSLTRAVNGIVAEREQHPVASPDLLNLLIHASGPDGEHFSAQEVRDQCLTLLLAGHETVANALSWTWHLLAEHPRVREVLEDELAATLGNASPSPDRLKDLPYLEAVVRESLRLYPPVWVLARQSTRSFRLGSQEFPARTRVLMAPWVIHRRASLFPDPNAFRPERWLDGSTNGLPAQAYIPFGTGPRLCIGRSFALLEMPLVVATISQRYRLYPVPGEAVVPEPLVTLRPRNGVRVVAEPRDPARTSLRPREGTRRPISPPLTTCPAASHPSEPPGAEPSRIKG